MNIVYMLLPALAWGFLPLAVARTGGRPINQIIGTALGTLIAGVLVFLIIKPTIDPLSTLLAGFAGGFWIIGQLGQYTAFRNIGVSKTMPLSTGLQLTGTSLIGVLIFGEWSTIVAKLVGSLGIVLLIVGVVLTSVQDRADSVTNSRDMNTLVMLIFTTLGYLVYNTIPRALSASGLAIFLPESIGMVVAVFIYILFSHQLHVLQEKSSWLNIVGGLIFSVAAMTYILSVRTNGINAAFVVSQLSVVISTLGSLVFLHEQKSRREIVLTVIGLILIVAGASVATVF